MTGSDRQIEADFGRDVRQSRLETGQAMASQSPSLNTISTVAK